MSNAAGLLPNLILTAPQTQGHGVSQEAGSLRHQWAHIWSHMLESSFFGHSRSDTLYELAELALESQDAGWDGYEAEAVRPNAVFETQRFLLALPFGVPVPSVSIDPDGDIELEWYVRRTRLFSVCISGDGILRYAGLFGRNEKSGRELFYEEVPDEILGNLRRFYAVGF